MDRRRFLANGVAGTTLLSSFLGSRAPLRAEQYSRADWQTERAGLSRKWLELLGNFPDAKCPLAPKMKKVDVKDGITRYHVSFSAEANDRVTAWLLVPETAKPKSNPAIICVHATTRGTGKDRAAGLAGKWPTDPPDKPAASRAYGLELARWGYVTLSIDLLGDGERIADGLYDSRAFYRRHPEWSIIGKNTWDVTRSVDFLETLDLVDSKRIGCVGHSLGGHTSLFAAAFEPRLAASCCNCGVLAWFTDLQDKHHWARPESAILKDGPPALAYVYIKKFSRFYDPGNTDPVPVDFESLMMMAAPRPLLIMANEPEVAGYHLVDKVAQARKVYHTLGAGDRLALFSFSGGHNYPPVAKRHSFNWLDRWLDHTPAVPTIWPNESV